VDPRVPLEEQVGVMVDLQREGKIRHIGLSNVSVEQLRAAQPIARVATVQNRYNLADRSSESVLEVCAAEGLGFVPWFPIATGDLARTEGLVATVAAQLGAHPAQVAVAWLLRRSPVMLPIPGTASVAHLEENVAAAAVHLTDAQFKSLAALGGRNGSV
jgi:aryl-alcohol dehydrogenase-like predicted oxidoreductase